MSYQQIPIKIEKDATLEYRIVGPSDEAPTPAEGYSIDPDPVEINGVPGKFWVEYRIIET